MARHKRPTCNRRNSATEVRCEKPAVAWYYSLHDGQKIFVCKDCMAKARELPLHKKTKFHEVEQ